MKSILKFSIPVLAIIPGVFAFAQYSGPTREDYIKQGYKTCQYYKAGITCDMTGNPFSVTPPYTTCVTIQAEMLCKPEGANKPDPDHCRPYKAGYICEQ